MKAKRFEILLFDTKTNNIQNLTGPKKEVKFSTNQNIGSISISQA